MGTHSILTLGFFLWITCAGMRLNLDFHWVFCSIGYAVACRHSLSDRSPHGWSPGRSVRRLHVLLS